MKKKFLICLYLIVFIQAVIFVFNLLKLNINIKRDFLSKEEIFCETAIETIRIKEKASKSEILKCIKSENKIEIKENGVLLLQKDCFQCNYSFIEWHRNDFNYKKEKPAIEIKNGSHLDTTKEFFLIECIDNTGKTVLNNTFARIFKKINKQVKKQPINILFVGFDSISREGFLNHLPITSNYLVNEMKSNILTRYNIVGDGTPAALIPLLTSKHEHELPSTIKNNPNSNYLDIVYPMIWTNYSQLLNYSTLFVEDRPDIGVFNFRMKGFKKPPVDHYMRPLLLANLNRNKDCLNRNTNLKFYLNYLNDFIRLNKQKGFFGLQFIKEFSHDDYDRLNLIDSELFEFLNEFYLDESLSNNTILILFSDHGPRFTESRQSIKGLLNERNPFFSIYMPKLFNQRYPNEYNLFKNNLNKLITPMDIHKTLIHLLMLESNNQKIKLENDKRSISLFETNISYERTCQMAGIDIHWCSCLKRTKININQETFHNKSLIRITEYFIDYLNNDLLKDHLDKCSELKLDKIMTIYKLESFISNKTSSQVIEVEWPKHMKKQHMNKNPEEIKYGFTRYLFQVKTLPNNAEYEFTVNSEFEMKNHQNESLSLNKNTISRINKYSHQADCISQEYPDLRKFCFCK